MAVTALKAAVVAKKISKKEATAPAADVPAAPLASGLAPGGTIRSGPVNRLDPSTGNVSEEQKAENAENKKRIRERIDAAQTLINERKKLAKFDPTTGGRAGLTFQRSPFLSRR